jgi:hypothetical protein
MNRRADSKRLLLPVMIVVATLLCSASDPAPAKGPQQKTDFTITTRQTVGCWYSWGRFRASGAINDGGDAFTGFSMYPDYDLVLFGHRGTMMIQFDYGLSYRTRIDDTTVITEGVIFLIADATGEHCGLIGTVGAASVLDEYTDPYDLDGDCIYGRRHCALEGSLTP